MSSSIEGTPIESDASDDFLTRGPDAMAPEPQPDGPSWESMVEENARGTSRWRRAPLLVLAVLLVFVLAGVAWFAANLFIGGGAPPAKSMATADARGGKEDAGSSAFQRASGQPLSPAPSAAQTDPQPKPPFSMAQQEQVTATAAVAPRPPTPDDPVTTDPQDAPRIARSEPAPPQPEPQASSPAPAAVAASNPLPPATAPMAPAPSAQLKPAVTPAAPKAEPAAPKATVAAVAAPPTQDRPAPPPLPKAAAAPADNLPAVTIKTPVPPAKPKPSIKMASRPTGTYAVQLSSVKSSSIAKREMKRLSRRFNQVLNGTELRIRSADLGRRGTVYRIQTAAVLTSKEAKRMCGRLKSRKQACFVVAR